MSEPSMQEGVKLPFCVGSRHTVSFKSCNQEIQSRLVFLHDIITVIIAKQKRTLAQVLYNNSAESLLPYECLFDQQLAITLFPASLRMGSSICLSVMIFSEAALLLLSDCRVPLCDRWPSLVVCVCFCTMWRGQCLRGVHEPFNEQAKGCACFILEKAVVLIYVWVISFLCSIHNYTLHFSVRNSTLRIAPVLICHFLFSC